MDIPNPSFWKRFGASFGWTRHSSVLLAGFLLVIFLIVYFWWPLAEQILAYIDWSGPWWRYFDWLLVGIFLFMTLTIMAGAALRNDALIVFVGMIGGLVIESWGTQTNLWFYYTAERPPLWIIPAWPIASLCIDRITRFLDLVLNPDRVTGEARRNPWGEKAFRVLYWGIFVGFYIYMLYFSAPTFNKTFTIAALVLVAIFILTPTDHRYAVLTFLAGSALGYFLERWGTTRECWTYYTYQTPPFFAVLAHGMAAVAFWRAGLLVRVAWDVATRKLPAALRRLAKGTQ